MKELNVKEKELLKEYSEGNQYLYEALCSCWENEIRTHACCTGHKITDSPYLSIILDDKSLPYIRKIVGVLQ